MNADKGAEKLRHAAERVAGSASSSEADRRKADSEAAEAHSELTQPEQSKGRPPAGEAAKGGPRPSNAGTDGP